MCVSQILISSVALSYLLFVYMRQETMHYRKHLEKINTHLFYMIVRIISQMLRLFSM